MHFNPIPILYGLFLGGGGDLEKHRFRPPSLYRVKQIDLILKKGKNEMNKNRFFIVFKDIFNNPIY